MTTTIWTTSQATQGGNATTRPATTQNSAPTTKQDIQAAAREFSEAIRSNVQQELIAARVKAAQAQGAATSDQAAPAIAPTARQAARTFRIQGRDGTQTITLPPGVFDNVIPPQVEDISIAFFVTIAAIVIFLPLARAFARRMDRRAGGEAQIPAEISSQLAHLNQSVDAIALEVERISEGQRFTTRLLSEQQETGRQTLPSGASR